MNQATAEQAGIPQSVLKQGKDADEAIAKIAKGEAVTVIAKEPDAEPAAPVKPSEPAKSKPEAAEPSDETWKAKYTALKGKYDAEVPRQAEEIAELRELMRRQQSTIDTLLKTVDQGGGNHPPDREVIDEPGKAATHSKGFPKVNKEHFTGYGDEVLVLVDAVNAQSEIIQDLQGKFGTVESRVETTSKNAFLADLARLCPSWEALNTDKGFLKWLDEKETPRSRETRVQLLDYYVEQQNAPQVASLFNDYIAETGWTKGGGRGAIKAQSEMEGEIVPAPDVTHDAGKEEASRRLGFQVVTREQLSKATRDRVAGRITEDEFNKITDNYQRTYAAVRAGKITL